MQKYRDVSRLNSPGGPTKNEGEIVQGNPHKSLTAWQERACSTFVRTDVGVKMGQPIEPAAMSGSRVEEMGSQAGCGMRSITRRSHSFWASKRRRDTSAKASVVETLG